MLIIGLGHRARHGKNTVAEEIAGVLRENGFRYVFLMSFAAQLKEFCRANHEAISMCYRATTGRELNSPKADPVYGYVDILQWFGTDVARKLDVDFWVKKVSRIIELDVAREAAVIFTDVRFPNEINWIESIGGKTVKVERLNFDGSLWLSPDRDPNHLSEVALKDYVFDYSVMAHSLDELKSQARSLAETILQESRV